MMELACQKSLDDPVAAAQIAEKRQVPEKYLVHILLQLKRAGLVRSVRGSQGGHLLTRPPSEITLYDVMRAIDGPVLDPLPTENNGTSDLEPVWREVAVGIDMVLMRFSLRDILEKSYENTMYYI
jgi:Rrf2 family transcriptional regulator, cysteine metabolism repressor